MADPGAVAALADENSLFLIGVAGAGA